jgi:hypothetical protein
VFEYEICATTSTFDFAGSDTVMNVRVKFTNGYVSPYTRLDAPNYDDFEEGNRDCFPLSTLSTALLMNGPTLSDTIEAVHFKIGTDDGWCGTEIELRARQSGSATWDHRLLWNAYELRNCFSCPAGGTTSTDTCFWLDLDTCNNSGEIVLYTPHLGISPSSCSLVHHNVTASADKHFDQQFEYVGCYRDNPHARALPSILSRSYWMTPEICSRLCKARGFTVFGLQYYRECWCGVEDGFAQHGVLTDNKCNTPCGGLPGVMCGGSDANSVYRFIG